MSWTYGRQCRTVNPDGIDVETDATPDVTEETSNGNRYQAGPQARRPDQALRRIRQRRRRRRSRKPLPARRDRGVPARKADRRPRRDQGSVRTDARRKAPLPIGDAAPYPGHGRHRPARDARPRRGRREGSGGPPPARRVVAAGSRSTGLPGLNGRNHIEPSEEETTDGDLGRIRDFESHSGSRGTAPPVSHRNG